MVKMHKLDIIRFQEEDIVNILSQLLTFFLYWVEIASIIVSSKGLRSDRVHLHSNALSTA